jgi:beta-lactamase class A
MRRQVFLRSAAACAAATIVPSVSGAQTSLSPDRQFVALEQHTGGRLGVFAVDTGTWRHIEHRSFEQFPMCSTFKLLAVAAVLARVDSGTEQLNRPISYGQKDLLEYAPVTRAHVADGSMTVGALCTAAIEQSDNTAGNLLVASLGGRDGFNAFVRSLGDRFTQLDRTEPTLNTALPGDPRDTTTPHAMAKDLQVLLLGTKLSKASRDLLQGWLIACETGTTCIRAGIPATWRAGDKTGSGERGTRNDVAVLWPPNRAPIFVAAYLTGATKLTGDQRSAALADVGRIVTTAFPP